MQDPDSFLLEKNLRNCDFPPVCGLSTWGMGLHSSYPVDCVSFFISLCKLFSASLWVILIGHCSLSCIFGVFSYSIILAISLDENSL